MRSAAAVRAEGPPPFRMRRIVDRPTRCPTFFSAPWIRCSPTSDSPPPSARPRAGSRGGRCAGRVAERTSISAQSAGDTTAAACPASRSWRFRVRGRTAHLVRPAGQPSAIVVGETHAPAAELAAQAPVFFDQIDDDLPFPPGEPAGQSHHSSCRAEASITGWSLYHVPGWQASEDVG
jgi:hypothetical protein